MECVRGVLIAIAHLVGCTPASVSESLNWTLIVQNMGDTWRNLNQLLKGKQLYSALLECTHMSHNKVVRERHNTIGRTTRHCGMHKRIDETKVLERRVARKTVESVTWIHVGATWLDSSPQSEHCQRGHSQDYNYCTSIHWWFLWGNMTKVET
jgi:hypothetical protein